MKVKFFPTRPSVTQKDFTGTLRDGQACAQPFREPGFGRIPDDELRRLVPRFAMKC
jgi:hypothetical protein